MSAAFQLLVALPNRFEIWEQIWYTWRPSSQSVAASEAEEVVDLHMKGRKGSHLGVVSPVPEVQELFLPLYTMDCDFMYTATVFPFLDAARLSA
jgi:hypothetical protein